MKTKVLTLVALAALALGTVNVTNAETLKREVSTVINAPAAITKIEVRGNVEVYVSDGSADRVKVYNNYYGENALVQNQNGVLRISSYQKDKLVVWVTANDLRAITAYDNAEVKSFGKLSEISLDVNLHDNATAKLNLDGYSASIKLSDRAKADINGRVEECALTYDHSATLNKANLAAMHLTEVRDNSKAVYNSTDRQLAVL